MMELYIYNRDLELVSIVDKYESFLWKRRYTKAGEFELHCPVTFRNLELLQKGMIIHKNDGDQEAGFINYRGLSQNSDGEETLVVRGQFLTGYLDRRIIWGTQILNSTAETAMRCMVNNNCINPIDPDRIIPDLILGDFQDTTETVDYETSYSNLQEEIESVATSSELGIRTVFDKVNKKLKFEVYKGIDQSTGQSVNAQCIFSKEFDNILEQKYTDSLEGYKNLALIGGIGEGSARKLKTVGTATGLDRYEIFVDQASLSNEYDVVTYDTKTTETIKAEELARIANVRTAITANDANIASIKLQIKAEELIEADRVAPIKEAIFNNKTAQDVLRSQIADAVKAQMKVLADYRTEVNRINASTTMTESEKSFALYMAKETFDADMAWYIDKEELLKDQLVPLVSQMAVLEAQIAEASAALAALNAQLKTYEANAVTLKNQLEVRAGFIETTTEQVEVVNKATFTDEQYSAMLAEKGNETLATTKPVEVFDSTINLLSNQRYKTDFDLGDIVTCKSIKWGLTIDSRITEIVESYEEDGMSIDVAFGNDTPTLLQKIKQKLR
ncbi:MAG: hypothetical protein CVU99_17460 [Firmicutes bacterium HGW-Firmicutes-4]|jgi:hypothetical protein|nr:MAG: hypothetical protein CVU99_17460 [Firmicutes bacterium HGW-Firmicutes-4]